MSRGIMNIILIERSFIIYKGLTEVLQNTGESFKIKQGDSLCELRRLNIRGDAEIIIVNPVLLENQLKEFQGFKKAYAGAKWVGMVHTYFDQQLLTMFDGIIYINDSSNKIIGLLHKLMDIGKGRQTESAEQENLSERETEVLKLLVEGNANKEIADKLNISTHTVISHRKNISQKTGIKSVSGLTIYAVVNKIVNIDNLTD